MKIGLLITARLKSTRLPMKLLKPLVGEPMVVRMIERLKLAKKPSKIVICTSEAEQDKPLLNIAKDLSIESFCGHPDDVLCRLKDAAIAFGFDLIISATADNPLVDPFWMDNLVDLHINEKADYGRIDGLPFGTFCYTISTEALIKACEIKDEIDTEVWGGYFTESGMFKNIVLNVDDTKVKRPEYRLTVDTEKDYELMKVIFEHLYNGEGVFGLNEVIQFLDKNPAIANINSAIQQAASKPVRFKSII